MMINFKKYPKYKNSGIAWLGEIPEEWKETIAKRIWKKESRSVRAEDEIITAFRDGTVTLRRNKKPDGYTISLKEIGYQGVRKKDLVIHQMDAFAGAIGVSDSDGKSTPVYSVCTPIFDANPYYYNYLLREMSRSKYILSLAKGIRERSTDFRFKMFGDLNIPLPFSKEQTAIANFLDYKLEKIDRFITKKKQLIELLKEQKAAIINHAVTKGVNPNPIMKPSGVEWLGDIPEGWEVVKLTGACDFVRGNSSFKKDELLSNGKYVALQYGKTYKVDEVNEKFEFYVNDEFYKVSQIVNYGDVIFISTSETIEDLGHSVFYNRSDLGLLGGEQMLLKPKKNIVNEKYLYYSSTVFSKELQKYGTGVKVYRFNRTNLKTIYIPVPPIQEQKNIVTYIETETKKIAKTISTIAKEIALVEEYKTALIAEAVTGKIDVREFEVPQVETPLSMVAEEATIYKKR